MTSITYLDLKVSSIITFSKIIAMEKQSAISSLGKTDKDSPSTLQLSHEYELLQLSKSGSEAVYEDVEIPELIDLNQGHTDTKCQSAAKVEKELDKINVVIKRMKLFFLIVMIFNIVILVIIATSSILGNIQGLSYLMQPVSNQNVSVQLKSTNSSISELTASIQSISLHLDTTDINVTSALNQLSTTQHLISHFATEIDMANSEITSLQSQFINLQTQAANVQTQVSDLHPCGPGEWDRVAYLNMRDPTQQCPSAWREYNTGGVRACGRPSTSGGSSAGTTYSIDVHYRRLCGRVVGYQFGSPDGFHSGSISQIYVDGISITHGSPRQHVWTYAAGLTETASINGMSNCPCSTSPGSGAPSFVGINYYCESGNPTGTFTSQLYTNDKLWDGKQCEGSCCTGADTPPWFKVHLSSMTSDDIEIRILGNEGSRTEDTPVELIEMYASQ